MRMRKKRNFTPRYEKCAPVVLTPDRMLAPEEVFPGKKRFCLEIGCGKGAFITAMAEKHPDTGFFALERVSDVILLAAERAMAEKTPPDNLRFLNADAKELENLFPRGVFDEIYLNFSDPWPKKGYFKRRLTYRERLYSYNRLLREGGVLRLKTDNEVLFLSSLDEFAVAGMPLLFETRDLHSSAAAADNIMTEYESNFVSKGMKIFAADAGRGLTAPLAADGDADTDKEN